MASQVVSPQWQNQIQSLQDRGFCLIKNALSAEEIDSAKLRVQQILESDAQGVLSSRGVGYGIRNLLHHWPSVNEWLPPETRAFAKHLLGPSAGLVRGLIFDKPPGRAWTLPWHRDRTIALEKPVPTSTTFLNATSKAGVPHVTAPVSLLSGMLTLRFSLDAMTEENGPLVVLPGSHHCEATDEDLGPSIAEEEIETIYCQAGDLFVMRPLLAHSSKNSHAATTLHRRVLHLELASIPELVDGAVWNDFIAL